jgi:hypothetical protein
MYNPSSLEIDFANALQILRDEVPKHLLNNEITHVENNLRKDNPIQHGDKDGDPHEIVVRIIQITG